MRYLSVCSGIEAATVAWHPLGWEPVAFAEIDPFACAVLRHHYPEVPNLGDFTDWERADEPGDPVDLLVGGTPCQSFSVAGLRGGLADARGNLALEFLRLLDGVGARWVVWENVPGVLSVDEGRAFGSVLGGLAELGYGFAYRVLDAQYFGVPQRRRRVFVVGHLGDWRRAAAVLFERHCLSGHPPPRRQAREDVAPCLRGGAPSEGNHRKLNGSDEMPLAVAGGQSARYGKGPDSDLTDALIASTLRGEGFDAGGEDGTPLVPVTSFDSTWSSDFGFQTDVSVPVKDGHGTVPAVAYPLDNGQGEPNVGAPDGPSFALNTQSHAAVAFHEDQRTGAVYENGHTHALAAQGGGKPGQGYQAVREGMAVRRLTPEECEALQGFPRGYTAVPYRGKAAADGPRYRALGNSFAVPVVAWIGRRIQMVEEVTHAIV